MRGKSLADLRVRQRDTGKRESYRLKETVSIAPDSEKLKSKLKVIFYLPYKREWRFRNVKKILLTGC